MSEDYLYVVQITDTHLFAEEGAELYGVCTDEPLQAVLRSINESGEAPDVVLATGDLVHDESRVGYIRLAGLLESLNAPVYCIAGNHDDPTLIKDVSANTSLQAQDDLIVGTWRFLFLNTHKTGCVGGSIDEDQYAKLDACLASSNDYYIAVCLHHHPVPTGSQWLDQIGLEAPEQLLQRLENHPRARVLMWGHVHQEADRYRNQLRMLATPSTCVQFKPHMRDFALDDKPPGWRWFRLYADGGVETGVTRVV